MKEGQPPSEMTRRRFFKMVGGVTAVAVASDQLPRVFEVLPPTKSEILFDNKQKERLKDATSAAIVFGGATVKSPRLLLDALTPALEPLGPVGGVVYAKDDLDVVAIGQSLLRLRDQGITDISLYCHSLGAQVAGNMLKTIGDESGITLKNIFLDCTPPSLAYTDNPQLAQKIANAPYDGGFWLTMGINTLTYKNPLQADTAYSGLLWDQLEILRDGEEHIAELAKKATKDNARVFFLTPQDPDKDPTTNAVASEHRLKEMFPSLQVYRLGGKQDHGNPPFNTLEYRRVITQALTDR